MNNKPSLTSFAVILALGLIITGFIIGNTWKKVSRGSVTITVTGSASKNIRSDLAEWQGSYSNEAPSMTEAYTKLTQSSNKVKNYLVSKGFDANKLVFSSVTTLTIYEKNKDGNNTTNIIAYRLTQTVKLESNEVDKVDLLSREATELILQGVEIDSYPPQFFYTKIGDLKVEMIGLASQDAKLRAEQIANSTGDKVGEVRSSKMGVIQINAKNSTDVSDYGNNDTSSLDKVITSVVTVSFSIE